MDTNISPKRPRSGEPNQVRCIAMASSPDELREISPYERKIGKSIVLCSKCLGEGKVRAPLSKKARARRRRMQQNNASENSAQGDASPNNAKANQPAMRPCRICEGSGLIAAPLSVDVSSAEAKVKYNCSPFPSVQPGISVAIIGGGIGGIALAAALQHRRIPCAVYERDISFGERKQGYGLTMQQGARALRSLGFFSFSESGNDDNDKRMSDTGNREGSDSSVSDCDDNPKTKFGIHSTRHVVHKPDGSVVGEWGMKVWGGRFEKNGRKHAKRQNAHISRQNLRKLLMESLLPGTIRWGHRFVAYSGGSSAEPGTGEGKYHDLRLTFRRRRPDCKGNGKECEEVINANATIVVGCDGIRSVIRAKKLGDEVAPLRYLGCIVILGITASPNSALTDGETVFQTADGVTRLYAMPFARAGEAVSPVAESGSSLDDDAEGLSMWQLSFPMEEADAKRLSQLGSPALKAEALKRCSQWHDPIPELLTQTRVDLITGYPCYDRALIENTLFREGCNGTPETITSNPFVTMLGDAAHPMSPFKGQGANQALLDGVLLARKLYSALCVKENMPADDSLKHVCGRIPTALAEFENEMLQRSAVKVTKSADAAKFLHTHVAITEGNLTRGAAAVEDSAKLEGN